MGTSAITGINLGVPAFRQPFVDGDLTAGVLTVNHNLASQYVSVTVYNNNGLIIIPDDVDAVTANQITIDLTSYGTLTGTYQAVVINSGATQQQIPVATDLNLSGQAAEDFPIFDGANWVAQGGVELVKVGQFTKDLPNATGTTAYTGIGFKPKYIHTFGIESVSDVFSHGSSDGTNEGCIYEVTSGIYAHNSVSAWHYEPVSGNHQQGTIQSFDSDGFTISWVKTGSPTGTARIKYTAWR